MNNKAWLSFFIAAGLIVTGINSYSQDSTTKQVPVVKKVYSKPVAQIPVKPVTTAPSGQTPLNTQPILPPPPADNSLAGQYNYLLQHTYTYHVTMLEAYHKSVMDTLNATKRKLKDAQAKIALQADSLTKLTTSTKDQLTVSTQESSQISFFGVPMSKTLFSTIMWGLVLVLGASLAYVIYSSGSNKQQAAYRTQLYDELTEEFKAYKAKANDKEKKLARELQTERNKLDELMGKK